MYIFRDLTYILWFRLAFYAAVWYLIDILGGFPLIKVCDYNGKKKRRWGDRKDGVLLRDLDGMHFITPLIYPNRCDNEAYIRETIDLTNMNAYLKKKNESETEFPPTPCSILSWQDSSRRSRCARR